MFRSRQHDPSKEEITRLAKIVSRAKAMPPCAAEEPAAPGAARSAIPDAIPDAIPEEALSEASSEAFGATSSDAPSEAPSTGPSDTPLEEPSEALLAAVRKAFPEMSTEDALAALRLVP